MPITTTKLSRNNTSRHPKGRSIIGRTGAEAPKPSNDDNSVALTESARDFCHGQRFNPTHPQETRLPQAIESSLNPRQQPRAITAEPATAVASPALR